MRWGAPILKSYVTWLWCSGIGASRRIAQFMQSISWSVSMWQQATSRNTSTTWAINWQLNRGVFKVLQQRLSVDLFALLEMHNSGCFLQLETRHKSGSDRLKLGSSPSSHFPAICSGGFRKIMEQKVPFTLLVAPVWSAQPWYSLFLSIVDWSPTHSPELAGSSENQLHLVGKCNHMTLATWHLSRMAWKVEVYHMNLPTSSVHRGENPP